MCPLDKTIHILSVLLVRGCFTVVFMLLSGRSRSDQIVMYIIQDVEMNNIETSDFTRPT